jgi:hypothetical protein
VVVTVKVKVERMPHSTTLRWEFFLLQEILCVNGDGSTDLRLDTSTKLKMKNYWCD